MFSRNAIIATLAVLSVVLFTSTANALSISNENDINNGQQEKNYTIKDGFVILQSLFGEIKVPIPEDIKAEMNRQKNDGKEFERMTLFGEGGRLQDYHHVSDGQADFFKCTQEAQQTALSVYSENYRNWEAFFYRNSLSNTMTVRYCCNLLEYLKNAEQLMTPACQEQIRLIDQFKTSDEVRSTCRQYDYHNPECFLVRWMYWWIPILALLLIVLGISLVCCMMKSRRSKEYAKTRTEEKKFRTSLVTGI